MKNRSLSPTEAAKSELAWYFQNPEARTASPAAREAAARIEGWLGSILTFHAGAVALVYTPRPWPDLINEHFHRLASVVVRLECAAHPAVGVPVAGLEAAAAARIVGRIIERHARRGRRSPGAGTSTRTILPRELGAMEVRARGYFREALAAYTDARGGSASVRPPDGDRDEPPDTARDPGCVPCGEEAAQ